MNTRNSKEGRSTLIKPLKGARTPTVRQMKALEYLVENGSSKGEALRVAGYSEAVATQPHKVFNSRAITDIMNERGIDYQKQALEAVERSLDAKKPNHIVFSLYNPERAQRIKAEAELAGQDATSKIKEHMMTDDDIRDFLKGMNAQVYRITHGETSRHVYFYTHDSKAQQVSADMIFQLLGSYAPKKIDGKHTVGVFSLSALRKEIESRGIKVIE